jgi:hypothetical protein
LPDPEYTYSGNLIISQMNIDSNGQNDSPSLTIQCSQSLVQSSQLSSSKQIKSRLSLLREAASAAIGGGGASSSNLFTRKKSAVESHEPLPSTSSAITMLPRTISNTNLDYIKRWMLISQNKPQSELTSGSQSSFICSHGNIIFCIDQASVLNVYEKSFTVELKLKHTTKLNMPNVRGLAVNEQYLAICYSGLKKDQLKGTLKNLSPSGVLIYRRDEHVVCTVHERQLEIGNAQNFKSATSVAMTEKYLFVCDQELRSIFQFDINTRGLVNSVSLENAEPYSVSVNSTHLVVSDTLNSILYLYEAHSLTVLNSICVKNIDKTQGSLAVFISEDDLLFVRIGDNSIALIDINFELRAYFNEMQAKIGSIAYLKDQQNHMLVVSGVAGKQFKLYGYNISLI